MSETFQTETIESHGITVRIEYFYDYDTGAPWIENDGHGVIRSVRSNDYLRYATSKKPGEVLFHAGRGRDTWIYDIQETTKIAKRDGWGVSNAPEGLTPKQITALAVHRDFEYCKGWINDDWHYAGIVCTVLDSEGEETDIVDSCWGFETLNDYHEAAAHDMAQNLAESTHTARLTAWREALKEARARKYWACRDIQTVGA